MTWGDNLGREAQYILWGEVELLGGGGGVFWGFPLYTCTHTEALSAL